MSYFTSWSDDDGVSEIMLSIAVWLQENHRIEGWTWPGAAIGKLWYQKLSVPYKCLAGAVLRWYHKPFEVTPYRTTTDHRELTVFQRRAQWLQVLQTPYEIWVLADDCQPLNP